MADNQFKEYLKECDGDQKKFLNFVMADIQRMRILQMTYFKNRTQENLVKAKLAEAKMDKFILEYLKTV